jgi:hypothetical protein
MCIAILNTPNITFSKSLISNCWDNNPDGAGLIWTDTKSQELFIFKELHSVEAYYNQYIDIRRKHPKSKIVLHFRISTSGGVNETNTHPFEVSNKLAFVHNGIISDLNGKEKGRSDTNLFNANFLRHLPADFLDNKAITGLISKFIGHSKLIFLDNQNRADIINPQLGREDKTYPGCWFSNTTYQESRFYDVGGVKVYKDAYKPKYQAYDYKAPRPAQPVQAKPAPQAKQLEWTTLPAKPASDFWKWDDYDTAYSPGTAKPASYYQEMAKQSEEADKKYEQRFNELKQRGYTSLTQEEWSELQELEMYFTPF